MRYAIILICAFLTLQEHINFSDITIRSDKLGKGKQGGAVYLARHLDGRHFAVKIISERFARSDPHQEVEVMRLISEKNVPHTVHLRFYHFDESTKTHYIGMDVFKGKLWDLERSPANNTFMIKYAERMVYQLFEAVASMHAVGVIYGDLHKQNVFYDEEGNLFIGDFGLATIVPEMVDTEDYISLPSEALNKRRLEKDYIDLTDITFNLFAKQLLINFGYKQTNQNRRTIDQVDWVRVPKYSVIAWKEFVFEYIFVEKENRKTLWYVFEKFIKGKFEDPSRNFLQRLLN